MTGEVNAVDGQTVHVSLFSPSKGEIMGDMELAKFPRPDITPGQMFAYSCRKVRGRKQVTITLPELKPISNAELAALRRQVERNVPKGL